MTRVVVVTGATGFLGLHLVPALIESGWDVRAVSRRPFAWSHSVQHLVKDMADRNGLRDAVAGADAVVHLAARVHVMRDDTTDSLAAFRAVNVEGTRALLEESLSAGVARFVFISSVKAMGEATTEPWTEHSEPHPEDPYGVSKLEAEHMVCEMTRNTGMAGVILRLPLVYGPGMKGNMLRLFRLAERGLPVPVVGAKNRRSLVYVENVVHAVKTVLEHPSATGETFFVSDGPPVSTPDLVRAIARALGVRPRLVSVPRKLLRGIAMLGDLLNRVIDFPMPSAAMDRLFGNLEVDAGKLTRVTAYTPPFDLNSGLARTAEWFLTRRVTSGEG